MTRAEAVRRAADRLRAAGVPTPELDARVLALAAFGIGFATYLSGGGAPAGSDSLARLDDAVRRRLSGEPVARLLGRREFWGMDFALSPETLVPRPDTETLVAAALDASPDPRRILDLGTGTGCVLVALLVERPAAFGIGIDRSASAAAVARRNAGALGVIDRAAFMVGCWGDAVSDRRFDLVVSNPPYVESAAIEGLDREVREHDPRLALDGGPDGLDAYRAIVADLPRLLAVGGVAAFEIGAAQDDAVSELLRAAGLRPQARADLAGRPRVLVARADAPSPA